MDINNERIILIEDNPGDVRLIIEHLYDNDIRTDNLEVFNNLNDAIAIADNKYQDALILLDLSLPDSDGIGTVSKIRKYYPNNVIVVLTGMHDEHLALQALREGAQDYLIKGESTSKEIGKVIRFSIERQNIITRLNKSNRELEDAKNELRTLASHLQNIREEERTNIAREVHDELGQQLTGIKMDVSWLKKKIVMVEPEIKNKFIEMNHNIEEAVNSIRRIAYQLRPAILDDLGLNAALEWQTTEFQRRTGIKCEFESQLNDTNFNKATATSIFRIYQESLTNVSRHSLASEVNSMMFTDDLNCILEIKDNGQGFDTELVGKKSTLGLLGMKERSIMIGAMLEIQSELKKGTCVRLKVPIKVLEMVSIH